MWNESMCQWNVGKKDGFLFLFYFIFFPHSLDSTKEEKVLQFGHHLLFKWY